MRSAVNVVLVSAIVVLILVGCQIGTSQPSTQSSDKDFAAFGALDVTRYPDSGLSSNEYVVYYPKNSVTQDMPVVVFLEGGGAKPQIDDYRGIMQFIASQGYYVIGAEQGQSYDSSYAAKIVQDAIDAATQDYGLTLNKIAVMGHSQGGGQAFYVMKYLQGQGYGAQGSLTLSLDGWFAFSMNMEDLQVLQGDVGFVQMNGLEGTGTDPRINLTIWNLVTQTRRHFFTLPENDHYYVAGDVSNKSDIRRLIGASLYDAFTGGRLGYDAIPPENKTTYDAIKQALKEKNAYGEGDCAGDQYDARYTLDNNDIDYCDFEAI